MVLYKSVKIPDLKVYDKVLLWMKRSSMLKALITTIHIFCIVNWTKYSIKISHVWNTSGPVPYPEAQSIYGVTQ